MRRTKIRRRFEEDTQEILKRFSKDSQKILEQCRGDSKKVARRFGEGDEEFSKDFEMIPK